MISNSLLQFRRMIRMFMWTKKLKPADVAKQACVSKSIVHRVLHDDTYNPTLDTLERIVESFGYRLKIDSE